MLKETFMAVVEEFVYDGTFIIETDERGKQSVHPHGRLIRDRVISNQRLTVQQMHSASIILVRHFGDPTKIEVFKDRFGLEHKMTGNRGLPLDLAKALEIFGAALEQVRTKPPLKPKAEED